MKKVAVILSGCGVKDGSEIHESVMALWALAKNGIEYNFFAPSKEQFTVVNHLTGESVAESRNVLVESARIARGDIKILTELNAGDFDGLLLPGGLGAAKNLCSFAYEGEKYSVDKDVEKVICNFHALKKPIVALCIAPMIVAKVLKASVTIGTDVETAKIVELVGGKHVDANYDEIVVDNENRVITTPCYMLANNVYQISVGIEKAVEAMKKMM
ncbi:isoprenoid biosynthesis glyoxalase ElbB [Bacteroidales bacterium OttesenSCG-928-I21]|nr:isoprenoid biosynthesis glyoxalase ElbB [Bacteroidales bacterium OttesenSCG-928-I21]